ncbi:MAG: GcvT family protein, partial [Acidimicrobiales bacterium]
PKDAKANPADITQALARGARGSGVTIRQGVKVTGFRADRGRVVGVDTSLGSVECEYVVNCAGQWAKAVAASVGVVVPLQPAEHFYIVTEAIDGVDSRTPTLRDPDGFVYFKEEVGGLLMGGFEPDAKPWVASEEIPEPFEFQLLPEDWEQFAPMMRNAIARVPAMEDTGIKLMVNGPESFTPDHNFILGEAPEVENFFVAAGFNSSGIAFSGGAGGVLARWVVSGEPGIDITPVDIRRFAGFQGNPRWLKARVKEIVGLHFAMAWPNREPESARPLRRSPVHHLLQSEGASFGSKLGWERANWFAPPGVKPVGDYGWGRPSWLPYTAGEHRATREAVTIFDQTSFGKVLVRGRDAEQVLQYLCSNDVSVEVGHVVYTGLLNSRGGYEADVTVTRTAWDEYLLVTSSSQVVHDVDVLRRGTPPEAHVEFVDVTSSYAVFGVMGPLSRRLLQGLSSDDLGNEAFPFATSREIDLAGVAVRATRLTYVGELGWELYIPTEMAVAAFERLTSPPEEVVAALGGYYAIESLRLEKAYRAWGRELTPDTSPVEAGMTFACKLGTNLEFRGRPVIEKQLAQGVSRRLVSLLVLDDDAVAWGNELILRDEEPCGFVTSAAFGHSVGQLVAMGYVNRRGDATADREWLQGGRYQVVIGGHAFDANMTLRAPYDPANAKVQC